jgi:hypothetical protein
MQKTIQEKLLAHSTNGIGGAVIGVIGAAITIFIGIWVLSSVSSSITQGGWSTTANTTYTTVTNTTWNAINLLSVGLIVMAAVVILGYFGMGRK